MNWNIILSSLTVDAWERSIFFSAFPKNSHASCINLVGRKQRYSGVKCLLQEYKWRMTDYGELVITYIKGSASVAYAKMFMLLASAKTKLYCQQKQVFSFPYSCHLWAWHYLNVNLLFARNEIETTRELPVGKTLLNRIFNTPTWKVAHHLGKMHQNTILFNKSLCVIPRTYEGKPTSLHGKTCYLYVPKGQIWEFLITHVWWRQLWQNITWVRSGDAQAGNVVCDILDNNVVITLSLIFQKPPVNKRQQKISSTVKLRNLQKSKVEATL